MVLLKVYFRSVGNSINKNINKFYVLTPPFSFRHASKITLSTVIKYGTWFMFFPNADLSLKIDLVWGRGGWRGFFFSRLVLFICI